MSADPASGAEPASEREVEITSGATALPGRLAVSARPRGVVAFAHGSDSSRFSPRNLEVAKTLEGHGLATLLFDLLSGAEAAERERVFDVPLLGERLIGATRWLRAQPETGVLPVGYFGASTGAAAALFAAAEVGEEVGAVVSRGGRPDLAGARLQQVTAPTLLIVGGEDHAVLGLNREAQAMMRCPSELVVIPSATHLFEEPGALEAVAEHACEWFVRHLAATASGGA
jgi:putative phosphoribosyl transferase